MCSRALPVAALLMLLAAPAPAQDSARALAAMEARLDSLQRVVAREDSLANLAAAPDTVRVGGLRIATSAAFLPLATAAATEAWDSLAAHFGTRVLDRDSLPVQSFGGAQALPVPPPDVHEVARGMFRTAALAMWRRQDAALVDWLGGRFPVGPPDEAELALLASSIAVQPGRPSLPCLAGDLAACTLALGLTGADGSLDAWYAPETWSQLVQRGWYTAPPGLERLRASCLDGDQEACGNLLRGSRLSPPISSAGRALFVSTVLALGGRSAFARLTADTTQPLGQRFEAAAGVPLDEIVGRWQEVILTAAPRSPVPGAGEALGGLVTSVLVLGLSLRGSRWR